MHKSTLYGHLMSGVKFDLEVLMVEQDGIHLTFFMHLIEVFKEKFRPIITQRVKKGNEIKVKLTQKIKYVIYNHQKIMLKMLTVFSNHLNQN